MERRGAGWGGELEREKPEGERRCQIRKFPGGGGGDRERQGFERGRETWPVRRELPCGGLADGYQSNPVKSTVPSAPPPREILSPPSTSPPRGCRPRSRNLLRRIDESSEHSLGSSSDSFNEDSKGAATVYERVKRRASVAPIARLCHHRFHPSLTLLYDAPTHNDILETLLIAHPENGISMPSLRSGSSRHPGISQNSVLESVFFGRCRKGRNVEPPF